MLTMENIENVSEEGNTCRNVVNQTLLEPDDSITPRKRSWMFHENISEKVNGGLLLQQSSFEDGELTPTMLTVSDSSHSGTVEDKKKRSKKLCYSSFIETSKEDGECSTSFTDSDNDFEVTVIENHDKIHVSNNHGIKNNDGVVESYSEGGCMQASDEIDDSIMDSNKELICKSDTYVSSLEMDKVLPYTHGTSGVECKMSLKGNKAANNLSLKRKLSSEKNYESTPKRCHLFMTEGMNNLLSPIVKINSGILSDEIPSDVETPVIKSKFQGSNSNICSSTPLSKSDDSIASKSSVPCSDSQLSNRNEDRNINSCSVLSKPVDDSSLGQSDVGNMITVDELIADITQLCESCYLTLDSPKEEDDSDVSSKSEVAFNVEDHEVNVTVVNSTFVEHEKEDTTITESADPGIKPEDRIYEVGPGNSNSYLDESVDLETSFVEKDKSDKSVIGSERSAGRFKDVNLAAKIDVEVDKDKTNASKDIDACNTSYEDCVDDILCLENQYDDVDAGYVDEKLLEKSHFVANFEKSVMKDCVNESAIKSSKNDFITDVKVEERTEGVEPPLKVDINSCGKVKYQPSKDDFWGKIETTVLSTVSETKLHVCEGFGFGDFDADKHRKSAELLVEKEACKRWGTSNVGTPNSDVNLTASTAFHKKLCATGDNASIGHLECDSFVCTYMCEDNMDCKLNRYSCTNSHSGYMKPEFILHRLQNQKQLLGEMRFMSLFQLKGEIESKKSAMRQHHFAEFNCLLQRHRMQVELVYQTSEINSRQTQKDLRQMHQKHRKEMACLNQVHQNKFLSLCAQGKETLNRLVADYDKKVHLLDEIIEQLSNVQCHSAGLLFEYGPPVFVNLSKRPCRDTNWELSTVRTHVPAGIAQAVTLEENLYDHYYSYD